MWNTVLIFSNKRHGLQKKTLYRKTTLRKKYVSTAQKKKQSFFKKGMY